VSDPHCILERGIGETRALIRLGRKPVEVHIRRDSQAARPFEGDMFAGRITRIDKNMMAAFVDLGAGESGLLRFATAPNAPRLCEGDGVEVRIKRTQEPGKAALLEFVGKTKVREPGKIKALSLQDVLQARWPGLVFEKGRVDLVEPLCESEVALPSGGFVYIDHTRAGTMIDVDSGTAPKFKTAMEAAKEVSRQIRLRGIGGLILTDFPNLRAKKQRADVWQTFADGFNTDPDTDKIAPFSRFGTIEMSRTRHGPSIAQIYAQNPAETLALLGLRRLLQEVQGQGGARWVLQLPKPGFDWLEQNVIDWRGQLEGRIGARFRIIKGATLDVFRDDA